MSGVPPPLVSGAYNTLATYNKSLRVHVAIFDLVVLIEALHGPDYQNSLLPLGSASGLVHHGMYRLLVDVAWCCRPVDDTAWNLFVCSSDQVLDAGGTTYVLQHDFPCSRDVCPVGTDVAINISRRI